MLDYEQLQESLKQLPINYTPLEIEMVSTAGVRSPSELLALMSHFPSMAKEGVNFPKLSNAASQSSSGSAFLSLSQQRGGINAQPPRFGYGAGYPVGAAAPPGYTIPFGKSAAASSPPKIGPAINASGSSGGTGGGSGVIRPPSGKAYPRGVTPSTTGPAAGSTSVSTPSGNLSNSMPLDFRLLGGWPIRDQGFRGTCVSFATTACCEQFFGNPQLDLSEQFLYWAIKDVVGDTIPNQDGTWFEYSWQALAAVGICEEGLWPYNPAPIPGNISQADATNPTSAATQNAGGRLHGSSLYQTSGGAAAVHSTLQSRSRPVGVSLPVFVDPLNPNFDNWNTSMGQIYGRIFDPPPTSIVDGGHAVCITGFQPDPQEPLGGWFIVRNSWGDTNWGANLPDPSYHGPEPGYGQVSASYVDKYLWELFAM